MVVNKETGTSPVFSHNYLKNVVVPQPMKSKFPDVITFGIFLWRFMNSNIFKSTPFSLFLTPQRLTDKEYFAEQRKLLSLQTTLLSS